MAKKNGKSKGAGYEVGYQKPPQDSRFRPGSSGNPKGRPKGSKNISSILAKTGRERVTVMTNGRARSISKQELVCTQLGNKAASGDLKAIHVWFSAHRVFGEPMDVLEAGSGPSERDETTLKNLLKRMQMNAVPREVKE